MENLPSYIGILFIITTLLTVFLFYKASNKIAVLLILLVWMGIQSAISLSGFYTNTSTIPPRFILLIGPPVLLMVILFLTKRGKNLIDSFEIRTLTWLHIIRIPVEITLLLLFLNGKVPGLMTFEGRNFDVLSGITAPIMAMIAFNGKIPKRNLLLIWNFICLGLLLNIVVNAVLSAPFPFQKFAFDQPNLAVLYFPFTLLPAVVVPIVLFAHLAAIRKLITRKF